MKLRAIFFPLLFIPLFSYLNVTAYRVTEGGTKHFELKAFTAQVKEDFSPVTPLDPKKLND